MKADNVHRLQLALMPDRKLDVIRNGNRRPDVVQRLELLFCRHPIKSGEAESFPLVKKKLRGPYSNRHQTHLAFCRDYSAVHGAIFSRSGKDSASPLGMRFPTLAAVIVQTDTGSRRYQAPYNHLNRPSLCHQSARPFCLAIGMIVSLRSRQARRLNSPGELPRAMIASRRALIAGNHSTPGW